MFYKQYLEHSVTLMCIKIQGDALVKAFLHGPATHIGEGWLIPLTFIAQCMISSGKLRCSVSITMGQSWFLT